MTRDAVRTAILSDQPWARLDELVRVEMAAGRSVRQIGDELGGMQTDLEDTPGLSVDGGDALLDTLESLHRMGPRKYWYTEPPALPTADEVTALSRWARAAFAARCTRRVLPLFRHNWPDSPSEYGRELQQTVELVESVAEFNNASEAEAGLVTCAAYALDAVINSRRNHARAAHMVQVLPDARHKLRHENNPLFQQVYRAFAQNTAVAIADCLAARPEEYDAAWRAAVRAIRTDFDRLVGLAREQRWTDATPVPASVFGPMWPDGQPPRWPEDGADLPDGPSLDPTEVIRAEYQPGFAERTGHPPPEIVKPTAGHTVGMA